MENKHFLFLIVLRMFAVFVFISIFFLGCDSTKSLDWNQTASDQHFKIGDIINVEGAVVDPIGRRINLDWDSDSKTSFWIKGEWESKTHTSVYNPNEPEKSYFNPNAPIGVVICTIYNPSAYEDLARIDDMYPKKSDDLVMLIHRIKFTGTIYSFERKLVKSYNDKPDIYLACVRIHVTDLEVIHTRPFPLKKDKKGE